MSVTYDVYRRYAKRDQENPDIPIENDIYYGKRYEIISSYDSFSITLNFRKRSKFKIRGDAVDKCPFEIGDSIIFYRNAELFFTGLVNKVEVKCKDVVSGVMEWEAEGEDEGVIFSWRVILTDKDERKGFQDLTFDDEIFDNCDDYAYDRLRHYIRNCFDRTQTLPDRAVRDMNFPKSSVEEGIPESDRGEKELSAYRLKKLNTVLEEIGKEANLYPRYVWDPISGKKNITIPIQRDLSGMDEEKEYEDDKLVVIAPPYGNVAKWSVTRTFPKFNAIWVCSGESKTTEDEIIETPKLEFIVEDGKITGSTYGALEFFYDDELELSGARINEEKARAYEEQKARQEALDEARKARQEAKRFARLKEKLKGTIYENTPDEVLRQLLDSGQITYEQYGIDIQTETIKTIVWVYAEDTESIKKYGRIEQIVTKSDIKITEPDTNTEEDETLTEDDVIALLEDEARKQLQDNAAKEKYSITLAEIDDLLFMRDWKCGDKVKVVIDGKVFASTIETVSVSFAGNKETLVPTIGDVEEGLFSDIFEMISGIDRRMEIQEEAACQ